METKIKKLHILLVRDDRLGDLMLTAPAVQYLHDTLRASNIEAEIDLLANSYTEPAVPLLRYIRKVITHKPNNYSDFFAVCKEIKSHNYDAAISFFSSTKSASLLFFSGIPYRLAPKTKLAQFLYNHTLKQRRSRSEKPEHTYNKDLVVKFAQDFSLPLLGSFFFRHHPVLPPASELFITDKPIILVHPSNGDSARNIPLVEYAVIIESLLAKTTAHVYILAGPNEKMTANVLHDLLLARGKLYRDAVARISSYYSVDGIMQFAANLSNVKLFIAASTGTLHVAALFNVATMCFFSSAHTAGSLRWQPINNKDYQVNITGEAQGKHLAIDIDLAVASALQLFNKTLDSC